MCCITPTLFKKACCPTTSTRKRNSSLPQRQEIQATSYAPDQLLVINGFQFVPQFCILVIPYDTLGIEFLQSLQNQNLTTPSCHIFDCDIGENFLRCVHVLTVNFGNFKVSQIALRLLRLNARDNV